MIKFIFKYLGLKLFYTFGFPKVLPFSYTFSLLYSCNSRCKTCNIYRKRSRNLVKSEYEKIFTSIGKSAKWIVFTGGEPFLKRDIANICLLAYKICKPKIITIFTNGLLTNKVVTSVKKIAISAKKTQINVTLSLDGLEVKNDIIRGYEGSYKKVLTTYKRLKKLKIDNLKVGIHSTISKYNIKDFVSLSNHITRLKPDYYTTEITGNRSELGNKRDDIVPNRLDFIAVMDYLIHNIKNENCSGWQKTAQLFKIEYYKLVKKILKYKVQIIPCYAGIASAQISPEGNIWICPTKAKNIGSLRKNRYNFPKIWFSEVAKKQRILIKDKKCYCPFATASYTSILLNKKSLILSLFKK